MKKITTVAGMLFGSSLVLGCAASVETAPPPQVSVQAQAQVDTQAGTSGTAEVDVAPAPEAAEPEELVATSEPPEPVYEEQTDMPSPGMVWVGGYWQWTGNDWGWYYGGWYGAPEGRIYVEPYYEHADGHVVYVRGYWGVQGAEPRYYGGDRIVFTAAVRPEGYVRGQRVIVARSTGLPPGQRGHYGPRPVGARKRPLPTATAPHAPLPHGGARAEVSHVEPSHAEPAHEAAAKPEARSSEPKPESRPQPKPEAKPAPKPAAHGKPPHKK